MLHPRQSSSLFWNWTLTQTVCKSQWHISCYGSVVTQLQIPEDTILASHGFLAHRHQKE